MKLISLLFLILIKSCIFSEIKIPLTYALSADLQIKYPILLSFTSSETYMPFASDTLYLFNIKIPLQTKVKSDSNSSVIIGVKKPSSFVQAVAKTYNVPV